MEIIVPMHDDLSGKEYRLYYDEKKLEMQEYRNGWVSSKNDPDFILSVCSLDENAIVKFSDILNKIPRAYHKLTTLYPDRKISLLTLLDSNLHYEQLLSECASVGSILCYGFGNNKVGLSEAKKLIDSPRQEIVSEVFGCCSKSDVRLISKYRADKYSDYAIELLKIFFEDDKAVECVRNINAPYLNQNVIFHIHSDSRLSSYPFYQSQIKKYFKFGLDEIKWRSELSTIRLAYNDAEHYARMLLINNASFCFSHCRDIRSLSYKWKYDLEKKNYDTTVEKYGNVFPAPPICGTSDIIPISTLDDLLSEAREMNICVGSDGFISRIFCHEYYVYKVLKPERGTLGIKMEAGVAYDIDQLRLKNNESASEETWRAVREWFENKNNS